MSECVSKLLLPYYAILSLLVEHIVGSRVDPSACRSHIQPLNYSTISRFSRSLRASPGLNSTKGAHHMVLRLGGWHKLASAAVGKLCTSSSCDRPQCFYVFLVGLLRLKSRSFDPSAQSMNLSRAQAETFEFSMSTFPV